MDYATKTWLAFIRIPYDPFEGDTSLGLMILFLILID